jgi:diadenosine tetraphosphate (Ap4A) HIT family hydrolase
MCAGADPSAHTALQRLLPPGQTRFVAQTGAFAAFPTFGCFTPGYVLVVPRVHVLSFGQLGPDVLAEGDEVVAELAERISRAYSMPVLGFEYGNNLPGGRRIAHAHWHLLPSDADLAGWLHARMSGNRIESLASLPSSAERSYIAVRGQDGSLWSFPVPSQVPQVVRLRRLVAELDPRVVSHDWDWASHNYDALIRQTVADLSQTPAAGGTR